MKRSTLLKIEDLLRSLALACRVLTGVALVALTLIFGWLVFGRYVLNDTPTWVEQVSLLLITLITFVGAAVGIHEGTHLGVTYFRDLLPVWMRTTTLVLINLVLAAFGLAMAWYGYQLTLFKWMATIPLLGLPEGLRAAPVSVAGVLIVLFCLGHLLQIAQGRTPHADNPETEGQ